MDECQVEYGRVRGWEKRSRLQTKSKVVIVPQRLMAVHQNPFPSSCPESKTTLPACLTPCLLLLGLDNKNFTGRCTFPPLSLVNIPPLSLIDCSKPWPLSSTLGPILNLTEKSQLSGKPCLISQPSHPYSLDSNWSISPPILATFHALPENEVSAISEMDPSIYALNSFLSVSQDFASAIILYFRKMLENNKNKNHL